MQAFSGRLLTLCVGLMCVAGIAACGSSSPTSSSSTSSTASSSASASSGSTAAPGGSGSASSSKPPFVIAYQGDSAPGVINLPSVQEPGIQAFVKYINDQLGGIGGRPLKVVSCDGHFDPAQTEACTRTVLSEGAQAIFGLAPAFGSPSLSIAQAAGVPTFDTSTPQEDSSHWNVGLMPGTTGEYSAMATYLCTLKPKRVGLLFYDEPIYHTALERPLQILKNCNVAVTPVYLNPTSPDLTPGVVQVVLAHPDYIMSSLGTAGAVEAAKALVQQGFPLSKVIMDGGELTPQYFNGVGSAVNGEMFTDEFDNMWDTSNPDIALYHQVLSKYGGGDPYIEFKLWTVSQLMTIYDAAKAIGFDKVDGKTLAQYFAKTPTFPIFGSHAGSTPPPNPSYPGVRQQYVGVGRYENGKLVNLVKSGDGWILGY
jgi:branched-chain amino acid transport system substrate-binding protein